MHVSRDISIRRVFTSFTRMSGITFTRCVWTQRKIDYRSGYSYKWHPAANIKPKTKTCRCSHNWCPLIAMWLNRLIRLALSVGLTRCNINGHGILERASQEFDTIWHRDKREINRNGLWHSAMNSLQLNDLIWSICPTFVELTMITPSYFD